jgi:nascent polypeptide-associated complex subunit beta
MLSTAILALSLLPVSLAHFQLTYPVSRGFDDNTAGNFPCGGFNNVQGQRTDYLMSGSPLQLKMGHDQTHVAVYMAVGSDPGSAFNTVLRQQFVVTGLGDFCMGEISIPSGMNISEGTNATIQVVSNADGSGGGLYQVSCHLESADASTHRGEANHSE